MAIDAPTRLFKRTLLRPDAETRARLLETAQRLFGERGFKAVTVRDICSASKANVAAVNYHFGDKLGLYREVLQEAVHAMRETTEAAREAGFGQPPEEQLRLFVHIFMRRALAGGDRIHRLIARELNDPTPALDVLVEQGMRPRIEYLSGVIAELIGCDAARHARAALRGERPVAARRLLPEPDRRPARLSPRPDAGPDRRGGAARRGVLDRGRARGQPRPLVACPARLAAERPELVAGRLQTALERTAPEDPADEHRGRDHDPHARSPTEAGCVSDVEQVGPDR